MIALASVLLLALSVTVPCWGKADMEDSIEWYDRQVYESLQARDERYTEWSKCGYTGIRCPDGSPGYYTLGRITDGVAAIYEATAKEHYLLRLIEYSKNIMAAGKDSNGDGYVDYFHWMYDRKRAEGYDKWDYEPGYNYGAACYWNMMRTVARCARVGRLGPHYSKHRADIDEIVRFLSKHVVEKWGQGKQGTTLQDYLAQGCWTINGVHSHGGSVLADTWLATGDQHHRELAAAFIRKVRNAWVPYSTGSYAWSGDGGYRIQRDYTSIEKMQDTAHSIRVVRFAVVAYRAGLVVMDDDMEHLLHTFNKNLWRGYDRKFADYVNGADHPEGNWKFSVITQWVRLGAFDEATHERMVNWTGGPRRPDKYHEDRIHYYGFLALNLKLRASGYRLFPYRASAQH